MVIAGFTYFMFIVIYSIIYGFFGSNENVKEKEESIEKTEEEKEEEFIEDISDLTFFGENFFPRLYKYDIPAVDKRKFDD
ncbi:MAG TPA: hypothetical protein DEP48_00755 [Persephonella sp.]|uniref:Uncharacterized protein n=2 Tax=Hydrogenothermaceae TaxID=224027 RepID=C0QR20_PERMH|nr:hypothetical protein PERMA_1347 [Persephonella marina EX-H1]HCB68864.1 hypothetical protein [Persephonella sp.]